MKAPAWLDIKTRESFCLNTGRPEIIMSIRVRKWHPGWWLYLLRSLLQPS